MFTQSLFKSRISRCEQAETIENRVASKNAALQVWLNVPL